MGTVTHRINLARPEIRVVRSMPSLHQSVRYTMRLMGDDVTREELERAVHSRVVAADLGAALAAYVVTLNGVQIANAVAVDPRGSYCDVIPTRPIKPWLPRSPLVRVYGDVEIHLRRPGEPFEPVVVA